MTEGNKNGLIEISLAVVFQGGMGVEYAVNLKGRFKKINRTFTRLLVFNRFKAENILRCGKLVSTSIVVFLFHQHFK